jgi:hypothetical protein
MIREDLRPMVAYLIHYRWSKEPTTVYVSLDAPVTGVSGWKDSDPKNYVMVHTFGSDRLRPAAVSGLTRKPLAEPAKCSQCGTSAGSGCVQCRPDVLSY